MIDIGIVTVLALGFVLGMTHALDADHIVAVSTIVGKNRSIFGASIVGAYWGLGHTITLFLVGLLVLTLKISISPTVALLMELCVGLMLVFLGGVVAAGLIKERLDYHFHQHDGQAHLHVHKHSRWDPHDHQHAVRRRHRSMVVGMVHGLAGSAALMLLVMSSLDSILEGLFYILIFGLGSVTGMMGVSTLIGLPFMYSALRFSGLNWAITGFASVASMVLGTAIIYEIGFVKGLF